MLFDGRISPDYNPFASSSSIATTSTSPIESGSGFPSRSSSRSSSVSYRRSLHVRSHTDVPTTSKSQSHHHPLRGGSFSEDANVTRPTLTRRIKTGQLVDVLDSIDLDVEDDDDDEQAGPDEETVLVHEVTAKDSLAGVSLKYGISLADLRRANHMWTTDSIHLRKMLYIPLDKATRATLFLKTPPSSANGHVPNPNPPSHRSPSTSKIRRVPVSEMSFFPPPSTSSKLPPTKRPPSMPTPIPPRPTIHPHRSSPNSNSLSTLLSSTRDTIIARLSFDGADTDRGEAHQLGDVQPSRRTSEDKDRTPRPPYRPPPFVESKSVRVRTSQLEPSEQMQLPGLAARRRSLASVDFDP